MRNSIEYIIAATASGFIAAGASGQCVMQESQITAASTTASGDAFGNSVAVSPTVAVVGAMHDDDRGLSSGTATAFRLLNNQWIQHSVLVAYDGVPYDEYGTAVATSGDWIFVGSPKDDDINGADSGSASYDTGAVYAYQFVSNAWQFRQKLYAGNGSIGNLFGTAISANGEWLAAATTKDNGGPRFGAVFMFHLVGGSWVFSQKITPADGAMADYFGESVSLQGTRMIVGSKLDDDYGSSSGSAYIFELSGNLWTQRQKLVPPDGAAYDWFGASVGIAGDRAVVGTPKDDDQGLDTGSVYVFRLNGTTWTQESKLYSDNPFDSDFFGQAVGVSATSVVVGANQSDTFGYNSGAAYSYKMSSNGPTLENRLSVSVPNIYDTLGTSVAVAGDIAFVGSPGSDNVAYNGGLIRVFKRSACTGNPDVNGDSSVNVNDLLLVISQWGTCPPASPCSGDVVVNGQVDVTDLLAVIGAWG